MSQVVRYFHIRPIGGRRYRGATVRVFGDTERVGQVDVQVTFCSKGDNYCKYVGRAEASMAPIKVVPLRYLPNELARIEGKILGIEGCTPESFYYAVRYFLPKE